ncbi:MAG: L-lactate dehydrogenase [Chloroflexi bacterium]|nr:MAG: L-lactate dehydrogenase [Chloroflexota bacterium]MBL1197296.1 L-lactate dehydrogenase [Chloroflexota bacterium]NOH14592.1 L-lactate dehydrogenase [Chloroflexota bacterium]
MKIGIVGAGFVGATCAYALVMRGIGREIVLVDLNEKRSQAEADDIFHAVPFAHSMEVRSGEYKDLAGSRIVVVSAGVNQEPGETRLHLLTRNAAVFKQVIPGILKYAPDAILVIATNPVDVMTHLAARYARAEGRAPHGVLGTGTTLDTARFRALLARQLGIDPPHVHAYVLGEHGDSEVLVWSGVEVGGTPLLEYCQQTGCAIDDAVKERIDGQVRRAAYSIIEGKGATYYGIGSAVARICEVILKDQRAILTVCTPVDDVQGVENVTVAMPIILGGEGVIQTLSVPLNAAEAQGLQSSASIVRSALDELQD